MKRLVSLAMAALIPVGAMAQNNYNFDEEVNAELEKMYRGSAASANQAQQASPHVQVNVASNPASTSSVSAPVAQQAVAPQALQVAQVQKQPTTLVEASPLQESKAELIRKSRQDAEVQTEQKIVEKLETARMEDEKKRAEVLFGDKFTALQNKEEKKEEKREEKKDTAIVPVVIPEQTVAPAPVIIAPVQKAELDKGAIRSEVRASLAEMKESEEKKPMESRSYVAGLAGLGDYGASNVKANYSVGFAAGQKFNDRLMVEGSFIYSSFDVEQRDGQFACSGGVCGPYPRITGLEQYQTSAIAKYQFLGGMFRPVLGGAFAYTYRSYQDKQLGSANNNAQSHSVDVGVVTGADLEISQQFSIGLDLRYMWNLTNKTQSSGYQKSLTGQADGGGTPIEQLGYTSIGLVGRATF